MMNKIKNIAIAAIATVGIFSTALISCNSDKCKSVVCANGGTCNTTDGSCTCASGYEGTLCADAVNAKFVSTWSATDQKTSPTTGTAFTYAPQILAGSTNLSVNIKNMRDAFFTNNNVTATVTGSTITIPSQIPDGNAISISGTGTLATKTLTLTYQIIDGSVTPSITYTYTGTWIKP